MPIIDNSGLLTRLSERSRVVLELGCGANKRDASSIGIDALDLPGVDLVGDVFEALAAFPSASVDAVASYHFFEHVDNLPGLLHELARVMKQGADLKVVAPHFSNPWYYSDYTHRRFFGLYTFCYLARSSLLRRAVPTYDVANSFELTAVSLEFKSTRPFYVRHGVKRVVGAVFNASTWLKEFYEENLCWLFPCYEVRYTLVRC
jgi:SAM-dependent methyltransferase